MHDHDRDAIFARRALFISTALAGLACTTHEPPEQPHPQPEQHEVAPIETEDSPVPEQPSGGARPPWSELMAAAPPLDVPAGLSKHEAELLSGLESHIRSRYAELEKVWTALPDCAPSQADCEGWTKSVEAILLAQSDVGSLCGYSPEITNTFIERERAHDAYLQRIGDLLLADLDAAARAHTAAADVGAWTDLHASVMRGQPHPCLSCARPVAQAVTERVSFDDGQAALSADAKSDVLKRVVEIHGDNGKARLIVRGHADPSEADPDGLAKRRAEAVATELIGLGVRKADLEVRSYGAKLLLTRDAAQAGQNRRVDFEVEPR